MSASQPVDHPSHTACVDAWLARSLARQPHAERLRLLEAAVAAIWARAHRPLSEITLIAVLDRVLVAARARTPPLAAVRVDGAGVDFGPAQEAARGMAEAELLAAARTLLVELLTVLGVLTGEILTPGLHTALAAVTSLPPQQPQGGRS